MEKVNEKKEPSDLDGLKMFSKWISHAYYSEDMDVSGIIQMSGRLDLSEEEIRAYDAPYPSRRYKAGAHIFPYLIPTQLQENENYWVNVFEKWDKPFLVAFIILLVFAAAIKRSVCLHKNAGICKIST